MLSLSIEIQFYSIIIKEKDSFKTSQPLGVHISSPMGYRKKWVEWKLQIVWCRIISCGTFFTVKPTPNEKIAKTNSGSWTFLQKKKRKIHSWYKGINSEGLFEKSLATVLILFADLLYISIQH